VSRALRERRPRDGGHAHLTVKNGALIFIVRRINAQRSANAYRRRSRVCRSRRFSQSPRHRLFNRPFSLSLSLSLSLPSCLPRPPSPFRTGGLMNTPPSPLTYGSMVLNTRVIGSRVESHRNQSRVVISRTTISAVY